MAASTASNSNRSTPACSPILRKRSRSPTPQDAPGDAMVEKGSEHSSDKSPSTPEQGVQRSCSSQSGRSGAKNSKIVLCLVSVAGITAEEHCGTKVSRFLRMPVVMVNAED
ncbi:hypothetical protein TURU_051963 [Turdus rufiventris]|nr:hypothetical protein TURU_051963 [Turdus rufiventris]